MSIDLSKFKGILPYDSQAYGIYQPILGWRSSLQIQRITRGLSHLRRQYLQDLTRRLAPAYSIQSSVADAPHFGIEIAKLASLGDRLTINGLDSLVTRYVLNLISKAGAENPANWTTYTSDDNLRKALSEIQTPIKTELLQTVQQSNSPSQPALSAILQRESVAAGALSQLNKQESPEQMRFTLTQGPTAFPAITPILKLLAPGYSDITRAALSPIGVAHLFREFFFEFATFLGSPVQHVWLSPGGSVELYEISTRKTTVERTIEQMVESTLKSEKDTTTQDELSNAVKQDNSSDTKLGVAATSNTSVSAANFLSESASVTGSFSMDQQQKEAREQTHKATRQQTQKLSSEIRQSYKSTLRTVTEATDTNSKRYVLQNTTDKLVNYELRRKMRQVGVQIQDSGTRLCWQTFVDCPGDALGVSELVHAAPTPDLQSIKSPEDPPDPEPIVRGEAIVVRGTWNFGDDPQQNFVPVGNDITIVPPAGYICYHLDVARQDGPPWTYLVWPEAPEPKPNEIRISHLPDPVDARKENYVVTVGDPKQSTDEEAIVKAKVGVWAGDSLKDNSQNGITLQVTPLFRPSKVLLGTIAATKQQNKDKYSEDTKAAYQKAMFDTIRERVKFASAIQPRPFLDLREEERIVVYRRLVGQLLKVAGVSNEDRHVRHLFSEVVASMFDMDNMLYFVAPDWWLPRQQVTVNDALTGLGVKSDSQASFVPGAPDGSSNVVGWGGPRALRSDNYHITDDSAPAKLGSSLGWLLQLDGDNFRNAFLNAPWVKAVIPIREGHEWKALEWLRGETLEGSDGLDATYQEAFSGESEKMIAILRAYKDWPDPSLAIRYASLAPSALTILDAIRYLVVVIQAKQAAGKNKIKDDTDPTLSYLPTDMVFEHGFDPLTGGFAAEKVADFEVFDQWIEILPTDQIVPVEVTYDPKTGMQI